MRSRTSSCNMRVFKKDLTRFAPVWAEYSVFLLIVQYFLWSGEGDISDRYSIFLGLFSWVNAVYGFIVAVSLLGYLADPRECSTVHSFPIRREAYFTVHLTAGFLMALVPNAVFCLLNLTMAENGILFPFAGMMLEFVFFYGLAVFCMTLTGRKLAAATVYALINWLAALALWAVQVIYLPLLPGVRLDTEPFFRLCPVIGMTFGHARALTAWHGTDFDQLCYIALCAAVGVGLMALALVLYRRRKLEYAGDFLAVKWLEPVFLTAFSIACGCVLSLCGNVLFGESAVLMLVVGLLVGWFSGRMLMEKTARVFRPATVLWGGVLVLAVLASVWAVKLDPLGRVLYVPEPESVAKVEFGPSEHYFDTNTYGMYPYHTEDPERIAELADLHSDYLAYFENSGEYYNGFAIRYHLRSGATVTRDYTAFWDSRVHPMEERIGWFYSQPESVLGVESLQELKEMCHSVHLSVWDGEQSYDVRITGTELETLLETLFLDCKEGRMNAHQSYTRTNEEMIYLTPETNRERYSGVDLPQSAEATWALCREYLEKYTEWSPDN